MLLQFLHLIGNFNYDNVKWKKIINEALICPPKFSHPFRARVCSSCNFILCNKSSLIWFQSRYERNSKLSNWNIFTVRERCEKKREFIKPPSNVEESDAEETTEEPKTVLQVNRQRQIMEQLQNKLKVLFFLLNTNVFCVLSSSSEKLRIKSRFLFSCSFLSVILVFKSNTKH